MIYQFRLLLLVAALPIGSPTYGTVATWEFSGTISGFKEGREPYISGRPNPYASSFSLGDRWHAEFLIDLDAPARFGGAGSHQDSIVGGSFTVPTAGFTFSFQDFQQYMHLGSTPSYAEFGVLQFSSLTNLNGFGLHYIGFDFFGSDGPAPTSPREFAINFDLDDFDRVVADVNSFPAAGNHGMRLSIDSAYLPVPEPGTCTLGIAGLCLAFRRHR